MQVLRASTGRGKVVPTQFAAFCGAIIALVVAVVSGTSLRAARALEEEATEKNLLLLDQTRDLFDAHLGQIDRIVTRLGRTPASLAFLSMGPLGVGSPELSLVIDAATELQEYRIQNDFVRSVYLYAPRSGIVISSDTVYLRPATEYAYCIAYGGLDWAGFSARFLSGPSRMVFAPAATMIAGGDRSSFVLCANSLPIGLGAGRLGVALAAIDEAGLERLLGRLYRSERGAAFVMNSRGVILSSVGSPSAIEIGRGLGFQSDEDLRRTNRGGGEWIVSHATSRSYGLKFVSVVPRDAFFTRLRTLRSAAILIGLAFAALGLALAYALARRTAKPFFDIARALGPAAGGGGEPSGAVVVDRIKTGIGDLIDAKGELEAAFERRLPALRHTVLRDILEGSLREPELGPSLEDARLPLGGGAAYAACAAAFSGETERRMRSVAFEEALTRAFPGSAFACEAGEGAMAVLFRLAPELLGSFDEALRGFHASLASAPGLAVLMASGGTVPSLEEAPASYASARRLLELARGRGPRGHAFVDASSLPALPLAYAYPIELEARIIATVKAGRVEALDEALATLGQAARGEDERSIVNGLEGTLLRLLGDLPRIEGPSLAPGAREELDLRTLAARLQSLAASRAAELSGNEGDLKARLEAYVAERFPDPGLNLYMVAQAFDKKESYLYDFWKDRCGETFAACLERIRMERAVELLGGGDSVDEIARAVGYNSSHSFRRAFKRRFGVAPAEYKDGGR